jgi:hypothetical protein
MNIVSNRRFSRVNFTRTARLDFQGVSYFPCKIRDLSLSGMYVFSRFAESPGAFCQVFFTQAGSGSVLTIRAMARVVRKDKDGVAIEFTSMMYDSYMFLQIILLYEAEDPLAISLEYTDNCPFELLDLETKSKGKRDAYQ